jgi:hypothetical protein
MYVCPMHPQVRETIPGKCSLCGMVLVLEGSLAPKRSAEDFLPLIVILVTVLFFTFVFKIPMTWVTLIEDLVMAIMAAAMILSSHS